MAEPIPAPRGLPILGNALDVDAEFPMTSLANMAARYGEIFKLTLGGHERVFICSNALLNELMDEKRFEKVISGGLIQIRNAVHDGLFTAYPGEHNWEVAHRALMPAFGPMSINSMFDEMYDIATQLILKWARYGPDHEIKVTDDFTRLTLDSIALCAMGTRFNSFYTEEMHPFVNAMVDVLVAAGKRSKRPAFASYFYRAADQKFNDDINLMAKTAKDLITERRQNPTDKKDLLNAMLLNKDPKTGEHLTEDSIVNNMITFLIAGHETTSGLLSFVCYELLKNPETYRRAQKEVDDIVGKERVTLQHLSKLEYINAVLRETLRLHPPAPAFTVHPKQDEIIGGKYRVTKDMALVCFLMVAQRDPVVFGEDTNSFKPERMLNEPFSQLPPNAWKPFGNGARGCIGRPFAWQEALLALAMILQNFDLSMVDPTYQLQIQSTLTVKPKGFYMRAELRDPDFEARLSGTPTHAAKSTTTPLGGSGVSGASTQSNKPTMSIFYGSNAGTCEAMANSLAASAASHGFQAKLDILDKATDALPKEGPVVIVTSSYEGEPPDNAAHFVSWLKSCEGSKLGGVKYAVFGCGNRDWAHTYHKIPKLVDGTLADLGAERLVERGAADANDAALFDTWETWKDEKLWPAIGKAFGAEPAGDQPAEPDGLDIEVSANARSSLLRQDMKQAMVVETSLLTAPGGPQKRHLEIELPSGMSYRAGDYLAVLPGNPLRNVRRAMARFRLPWDTVITISPDSHTPLPKGKSITLFEVLSALVELSQPATSKQVKKLAETVSEPEQRAKLEKLATDDYHSEILDKNTSLLDVLERYPTADFSIGQFLAALPAMRIRQYSISSSPLKDPTKCTITYTVLDAPMRGQDSDHHRFLGVSSNYLRNREAGDWMSIAVRPSHAGFHLPQDDSTPVLMFCAGTGLAPFRAFTQERALKIESGKQLGPALLFYGCGSPSRDDIYADEFAQWEKLGAVSVRRAYSKEPDKSFGCRHVQDRIWHDRKDCQELFLKSSMIYMCGAGAVGAEINKVMSKIYCEATGAPQAEADEWTAKLKGVRYYADVFA